MDTLHITFSDADSQRPPGTAGRETREEDLAVIGVVRPRLNPERLELAFDLLRETVSGGELPQALLAVADREGTLRSEAYGPARSLGAEGIYWIASITKPIVGTAAMQLVEEGKLLIEDPVVRYLPEFRVNGKEGVKIWHLLTHTSGLADDYRREKGKAHSSQSDLEGACSSYLRFPPGSRFEYCSVSFVLLGEILHRLSGLPYPEYLRKRVFEPLGMVDTSFEPSPAQRHRVTPVHDFPQILGSLEDFAALQSPAGGLFSTADDLIAFGQCYLNGGKGKFAQVLGPVALRVMTSLHTHGLCRYEGGMSSPEHWGLSWEKAALQEGRLLSPTGYGHGGMSGTYLWIDPEAGLVVVFLTNRVGLDGRARKRIVNTVMGSVE